MTHPRPTTIHQSNRNKVTDADTINVIYIAGSGRSGSTLLTSMLHRIPNTVAVGELYHIWKRGVFINTQCTCSRMFSDCPFWQQVLRETLGDWDRYDGLRIDQMMKRVVRFRHIPKFRRWYHDQLPTGTDVARFVELTGKLYKAIARTAESSVIIDESKNTPLPFLLRLIPDIRLTVVHLVRDSRAVAYSFRKRIEHPAFGGSASMARYSLFRSSRNWVLFNRYASQLNGLESVNYVLLRYEDLVRDIRGSLAIIREQADIDELTVSDEGASRPLHIFSGNPIAWTEQEPDVQLDSDWRHGLGFTSKTFVTVCSARGLLRYRYPLSWRD